MVNRDALREDWAELRQRAREQWGGLTKEDLDGVRGDRRRLVEVIRERYGVGRRIAESQVEEWLRDLEG